MAKRSRIPHCVVCGHALWGPSIGFFKCPRGCRPPPRVEVDPARSLWDGADLLTPEALEVALKGHDARECACSGCALRRFRQRQ